MKIKFNGKSYQLKQKVKNTISYFTKVIIISLVLLQLTFLGLKELGNRFDKCESYHHHTCSINQAITFR